MTVTDPSSTAGLVARVKGILLKPDAEWDVIEGEPATVQGLFTGYAVPLALIGPICGAIGGVLIGHGLMGISVRSSPVGALVGAVVAFVLALVGVFILGLIIDALAPNFGGTKNKIQAMKVAVYSATAAWVAGVLGLIPALSLLMIIAGIYSLYLFFRGAPKLMKVPEDKAVGFVAVVIVVAIFIQLVIGAVAGAVVASVGFGAAGAIGALSHNGDRISGKVKLGGAEVDLGQLQAASKQMEAAANQVTAATNGKAVDGSTVQALPGETLKGLLPDTIAGFARTSIESSSGGVGAIQGSNAEGTYTKGDARITLSVTDMAAAGGLAGLAGAFNVNSSKETSTGYEKMGKVDGRMATERYDNQGRSGEYSVMVANRFMVSAEGSGVSVNDLKAAVSAVGVNKLEGLAKG